MTVQAVEGEMPLGVWLRQQRETRGWSRREQARRLVQAGRDAGDTAMPSADDMARSTRRWERGENEPTERYRLYYCKTFEIPAAEYGTTAPRTQAVSPMATVHAHGLSVSLGYVSGRLVIEISGLDTEDAEPEPGAGLSLVTSPVPPRQYGGRA
ncbi:MAG: helix-turn-helix domain-containing protein [Streptosporangiaceae bacterium]